jgi:hypothetical protein
VALARVTRDNSFGGQDVFGEIKVVDRLGTANRGMVEVGDDSPALSDAERAAVERALAPRTVVWVESLRAVIGPGPPPTSMPDLGAVLTLAMPEIDGDDAVMTSTLWCGALCGIGGSHTLHRGSSGAWAVTGTEGPSWIA